MIFGMHTLATYAKAAQMSGKPNLSSAQLYVGAAQSSTLIRFKPSHLQSLQFYGLGAIVLAAPATIQDAIHRHLPIHNTD